MPSTLTTTETGKHNMEPIQENVLFFQTITWQRLDRFMLAYAGLLFFLAGIICFFAYNWHMLPLFAKFGVITAALLISSAFPLFHGTHSASGKLGLLSCGILGGILMAIHGQVYQTGANSWTFFMSWAIFLLPLALSGCQTGLWFLFWLVSSLSGILYCQEYAAALHDNTSGNNLFFYQCLAQAAWFTLWETAAYFLPKPHFAFLRSKWMPRTTGVFLLSFLTVYLTLHIGTIGQTPFIYSALLYLVLITGMLLYYRKQHMDLFMTAAASFSLIILALAWLAYLLKQANAALLFLCMAGCLIIGSTLSGKYLLACYRKQRVSSGQLHEKAEDTPPIKPAPPERQTFLAIFSLSELRAVLINSLFRNIFSQENIPDKNSTQNATPWQIRLLMGVCAWIAVPCLTALFLSLFPDMENQGYVLLFLLLLVSGLALTYCSGIFLQQTALCLCLTGACAASILAGIETGNKEWAMLPAIIILSVSLFPAKNHPYRILAATLAMILFLLQADIFFNMACRHFSCGESTPGKLSFWLITAIYGLFYIAVSIKLASFWHAAASNKQWKWRQHLLTATIFAVLLLLGLLSILFSTFIPQTFLKQIGLAGTFTHMAGAGSVGGLVYLIFQTTKKTGKNRQAQLAILMPCLPLAVAAWYIPWLGTGLLLLALARQAKSLVLSGTAILFMAVCTVLEYYALSTTLLVKSFLLCGIGFFLFGGAAILHRHIAKHPLPTAHLPNMLPAHRSAHQDMAPTLPNHFFRTLPFIWTGIFLLFFAFSVHQKEKLLASGHRVILAMRPLDPRSLMQGDYMTLFLDLENDINRKRFEQPEKDKSLHDSKGTIIAAPDKDGIFHFVRFDHGETLKKQEVRLLYRIKKQGAQIGPGAFFFQEGQGKSFEKARFVELRADKNGEVLFTRLLDENRQHILPGT